MSSIILTNIYTTNNGSRLVCIDPPNNMVGSKFKLVSITLTGPSNDLYGIKYISRDDGSLWSNNITFESEHNVVKCVNVDGHHGGSMYGIDNGYSQLYDGEVDLTFNFYNDQIEPTQKHLEYDTIEIELIFDINQKV